MLKITLDGCEPLIRRRDGATGPVEAVAWHDHASGIIVEVEMPVVVQKVLASEFASNGDIQVATEMPSSGFAPGSNGRG